MSLCGCGSGGFWRVRCGGNLFNNFVTILFTNLFWDVIIALAPLEKGDFFFCKKKADMEKYIIQGGQPLKGEVQISGAKNAALGVLAAAVMADEDVTVRNLPQVDDVRNLIEAIKDTGAKITRISPHDIRINGASIRNYVVDNDHIRQMRAGYYLLGAFLGKYRYAEVALPGGCTIGSRPIDQHIKGFEALGATTRIENGMVKVEAESLHGARIYFDNVSVGATINVMLAATFAEGRTVMENVAKEPHVVDVANFLNSMGARIRGAGMDVIRIEGVRKLHGSDYAVIPDQIEAGTFMAMAAATHGDILVRNVIPKHLECISLKLREIGCEVRSYDDAVRVIAPEKLLPTRVRTYPYPGFPTDMQPQTVVVLALAGGSSVVRETIFENRFKYVDELKRMGADVTVESNTAFVHGVKGLSGADVVAPDLRAGAALVIAALSAEGVSGVDKIEYIQRGYEDFDQKIRGLGGRITCVKNPRDERKAMLRYAQ